MRVIYPRLAYEDPAAAVEWLIRVFGFAERTRKDNLVWLELGDGQVMISGAEYGLKSPRQLGGVSHRVNVYVDDVDAHYRRATAGGAKVCRDIEDMPWGERRYEAFDCEGHWWHFAQRL